MLSIKRDEAFYSLKPGYMHEKLKAKLIHSK